MQNISEGIAAVSVAISLLPILSLMRMAWRKKMTSWKSEPDAFNAWALNQRVERELVEIPQTNNIEEVREETPREDGYWASLMEEADAQAWAPGRPGKMPADDALAQAKGRVAAAKAALERAEAALRIAEAQDRKWAYLVQGLADQQLWAYVQARSGFFASWCQTEGLSEDVLQAILDWKKGGRYVPILCQIGQVLGNDSVSLIRGLEPADLKHLYWLKSWELVPTVRLWVRCRVTRFNGYWEVL